MASELEGKTINIAEFWYIFEVNDQKCLTALYGDKHTRDECYPVIQKVFTIGNDEHIIVLKAKEDSSTLAYFYCNDKLQNPNRYLIPPGISVLDYDIAPLRKRVYEILADANADEKEFKNIQERIVQNILRTDCVVRPRNKHIDIHTMTNYEDLSSNDNFAFYVNCHHDSLVMRLRDVITSAINEIRERNKKYHCYDINFKLDVENRTFYMNFSHYSSAEIKKMQIAQIQKLCAALIECHDGVYTIHVIRNCYGEIFTNWLLKFYLYDLGYYCNSIIYQGEQKYVVDTTPMSSAKYLMRHTYVGSDY